MNEKALMDDDEYEDWLTENTPRRHGNGKIAHPNLAILKEERADEERGCEACGWMPGKAYRNENENWYKMLHVHHVIPVACMGENKRANLVVLCPNCHAFAHRMGRVTGSQFERKQWSGPAEKDELIQKIRAARSDEIHPSATPEVTPAKIEEPAK